MEVRGINRAKFVKFKINDILINVDSVEPINVDYWLFVTTTRLIQKYLSGFA
jgi:hypothetical protein